MKQRRIKKTVYNQVLTFGEMNFGVLQCFRDFKKGEKCFESLCYFIRTDFSDEDRTIYICCGPLEL
jgi:hypothetical protein